MHPNSHYYISCTDFNHFNKDIKENCMRSYSTNTCYIANNLFITQFNTKLYILNMITGKRYNNIILNRNYKKLIFTENTCKIITKNNYEYPIYFQK